MNIYDHYYTIILCLKVLTFLKDNSFTFTYILLDCAFRV